jgi:predicted dinucleotide-binding enzyme
MAGSGMAIGILGTGAVGQTLSARLVEQGLSVTIGTRDVSQTLKREVEGPSGPRPFRDWMGENPLVKLETFAEAAAHGEVVINATAGQGSLDALRRAGPENLKGKILIDVANALDFSHGMPPTLFVSSTDSLAEQIQRAFPDVKVVKALNTMNNAVMVHPERVGGGDHHVFVSGNDAGARGQVAEYLKRWFGWRHVMDLGDLSSARGTEMVLILWVRLLQTLNTSSFNFKIVR